MHPLGTFVRAGIVSGLTFLLVVPASARSQSTSAAKPPSVALKQRAQAQAEYRASAPGDAYFGRLGMSYLGIDNVFKSESASAGDHTIDPQVANKLKDADESLQAWAKAYPHDPELARTYYLAVGAYKKVWLRASQEKAWQYMHVIVDKFPASYFGKQVKRDLAIGFTEHYFGDALPCRAGTAVAAATPEPQPSAAPPSQRARRATPAPTGLPTPQASESPSAAPPPSHKPAAGELKVDLIAAPCAAATTSAAEPATATASAAASPSPAPAPTKSARLPLR